MTQPTPSQPPAWQSGTVFTVGHSTLPVEDFLDLLRRYGIEHLADIRTIPRSRHNPQFESATLSAALADARIGYTHMGGLGGLRRPRADSPNGGWRNESFRGYADYMQTSTFTAALDELIALSRNKRTAIMCAEAVPWRCHRSLVADALSIRGIPVVEILSAGSSRLHALTPCAAVHEHTILYPPSQASLNLQGHADPECTPSASTSRPTPRPKRQGPIPREN